MSNSSSDNTLYVGGRLLWWFDIKFSTMFTTSDLSPVWSSRINEVCVFSSK